MKLRRLVFITGLLPAVLILYFLFAFVGSFFSVQKPLEGYHDLNKKIYLSYSRFHVDVYLPLEEVGSGWAKYRRLINGASKKSANFLRLGWGSKTFYRETRTFADLKIMNAIKALALDKALIHVAEVKISNFSEFYSIKVSTSQITQIEEFFRFKIKEGGTYPGYSSNDILFPAEGRYSPFLTCNEQLGRALYSAGVEVGAWTPFSYGLLKSISQLEPNF